MTDNYTAAKHELANAEADGPCSYIDAATIHALLAIADALQALAPKPLDHDAIGRQGWVL